MSQEMRHAVGRPREFDEDQVLDAVMTVFWRQGYASTSVADLLQATGLHKGSLYQAFGDKHSLFVRALRRYVGKLRDQMSQKLLGSDSAFDGLRCAMRALVEMCVRGDDSNPGCMALNTLVENGPHDAAILAVLQSTHSMRMRMLTQSVQACQQEGSIRKDWSAERIASVIATLEAGLVATLKGPLVVEQAYALIDDLLSLLRSGEAA